MDVEPGAVEKEEDVLWEVEEGRDEREAREEEEDGPCSARQYCIVAFSPQLNFSG